VRSDLTAADHDWLRDDFVNALPVVDLDTLLPRDIKPAGVKPKLMQNSGVKIRDVVAIFNRVVAKLVRGSMDDASLDAAACHPAAKCGRVVVEAFRLTLNPRSTSEFGSPNYQSLFQ
jgi:hypothetical protein